MLAAIPFTYGFLCKLSACDSDGSRYILAQNMYQDKVCGPVLQTLLLLFDIRLYQLHHIIIIIIIII